MNRLLRAILFKSLRADFCGGKGMPENTYINDHRGHD